MPTTPLFDRIATAPISWGVCEVPGWGLQLPVERVLGEMSALGFTHTELGSAGWLPDQPGDLLATLAEHDLSLLASFIPLVLHDPSVADDMLGQATEAAALLATAGATHFNTAPVTSPDWEPRRSLADEEWDHLFAMLDRLEKVCADHGLHQVVHEHVGCVIETRSEVERMLANTATDLVLDTGHLAVGGFDPLAVATDHADRVGLVHLKDTRIDVARRLNDGELTLMEAVQADLFPALGRGDLPLAAIVDTLEAAGYRGWYVIEQDCAIVGTEPGPGEGPQTEVARSLDYLRQVSAFG